MLSQQRKPCIYCIFAQYCTTLGHPLSFPKLHLRGCVQYCSNAAREKQTRHTDTHRRPWPIYRVVQKIGTICLYVLTLPNINRFSNFFTARIRRKFVIRPPLKIPPHLKCVATLPCEMLGVLKAKIENKTTSVATHFKKLTTGNNVFLSQLLSKVSVSNYHIVHFLH